ncbi:MAG: VWA domain-containing protein [Acidobacteria bacterium]|nr:VWA domain-containing protein [Acidobacteriota bacterium]
MLLAMVLWSSMRASLWPATALAQNPIVVDRRPLRSSVELTVVTVTVRDAGGRLAIDLPRDAFQIYEDGDPQQITQFTNERVPVGLGLLLDISDSMFGQRIIDARATVERFLLDLLKPADAFFVMAFNHEPHLLTTWTDDASTVRAALAALKPWGGTAIYDAIVRAEPLLDARSRERAALVVISDGADTASDHSLRDVRSTMLRTDAFVYAIAIDSPQRRTINARVNPEALREITNQSGGTTEVVHDGEELDAATARIAEELNSQYVLGYSPPHAADGKYHSIRVKVTREGFKVRARNGYVATPR